MHATRGPRGRVHILIAIAFVSSCAWPGIAAAADDLVGQASRARGGAGISIGTWEVTDLSAPLSGTSTSSPSYEAWLQKGLDLHLTLETTLGFWQSARSWTETGTFGGVQHEQQTYLVPMLTTLKFYPATRPSSLVEPYIAAGAGVVLGIDREQVVSTDPLVPSGETTATKTGLGIQTGAGVNVNFAGPFGVALGGRYQWASFGENVGGKKLYDGYGLNIGLTYQFRYE